MNQFSMDLATSHPASRMDSQFGTGDKIRNAGHPMGLARSVWPFLVRVQDKPEFAESGKTDIRPGFVS